MFMQFLFSYLVNWYPHGSKLITAREFNAHVRPGYKNPGVRVQYTRTILMTKFASRALYAVPRVRIQSEVYFYIYISIRFLKFSCYITVHQI